MGPVGTIHVIEKMFLMKSLISGKQVVEVFTLDSRNGIWVLYGLKRTLCNTCCPTRIGDVVKTTPLVGPISNQLRRVDHPILAA